MPRVDTYGQRKVATAPRSGARKQAAETFASQGGPVHEAQAAFGSTLARTGINLYSQQRRAEDERASQIERLTALRQFNDLDHQLVHSPDKGVMHKRGLAVMESRDQVLEEFDTQVGEIAANVKTPGGQLFVEEQKLRRRDALRQTIDTHGSAELAKHEASETQATLASLVNGAIESGDPARIGENLADAESIIDTHGARLGLGPEARKDAKGKVRSQVHVGVVERMLAQERDVDAREYFEEVEDQIVDPKEKTRLVAALEEGTLRGKSQKELQAILSVHTDEADARAAAKKIDDPKLQDAVLSRIEHEFTIRRGQERQAHEDLVLRGLNIAERTGDWRKIPPAEWKQYTVGERGAIQNYLEQKAAGVTVKTNPHVYTHLSTLASSADPALRKAFVTANPVEWIDQLSPSDYKHMVDLQGKIRAGDVEAAEKLLVNVTQQTRMVDEALTGMGLDPTPPQPGTKPFDAKASERVAEFRRAVREAVSRHEQRTQKPATDADVQSIVDQLRAPTGKRVVSDSLFWPGATTTQAYAFETGQARVSSVTDVPASERRLIEAALRRRGKPISDAAIVELFNANLAITRGDR